MKNLKRTLLVGFIWGLIFFLWWMKGFLYQNWNFDIFSKYSWGFLYNEFVSGWVISATSDWVFVWTLILAVPLFLIGWNLFLKINWRKSISSVFKNILYFTRKKTAVVSKKKFKYAPKRSHQKTRPVPLHTTMKALEKGNKSGKSMPPVPAPSKPISSTNDAFGGMPDFSKMPDFDLPQLKPSGAPSSPSFSASSQSSSTPSFLEDDDFANMSLEDVQLPTREILNENISNVLLTAGYKVVADVILNGVKCDFIAMDEANVFVLSSDTQKGDWLADEERFNGEDPLWFSESSHRISPVYQLTVATKALEGRLQAKGFMQTVRPVLIERAGTIINAEDMQSTWKEQGVLVCRTAEGGPDELLSVTLGIPRASAPIIETDFEGIRSAF